MVGEGCVVDDCAFIVIAIGHGDNFGSVGSNAAIAHGTGLNAADYATDKQVGIVLVRTGNTGLGFKCSVEIGILDDAGRIGDFSHKAADMGCFACNAKSGRNGNVAVIVASVNRTFSDTSYKAAKSCNLGDVAGLNSHIGIGGDRLQKALVISHDRAKVCFGCIAVGKIKRTGAGKTKVLHRAVRIDGSEERNCGLQILDSMVAALEKALEVIIF